MPEEELPENVAEQSDPIASQIFDDEAAEAGITFDKRARNLFAGSPDCSSQLESNIHWRYRSTLDYQLNHQTTDSSFRLPPAGIVASLALGMTRTAAAGSTNSC